MRLHSAVLASAIAMATAAGVPLQAQQPSTLVPFASDAELTSFLRSVVRDRMLRHDSIHRAYRRREPEPPCTPRLSYIVTPRSDSATIVVARTTAGGRRTPIQGFLNVDSNRARAMADTAGVLRLRMPDSLVRGPRTFDMLFRHFATEPRRFPLTLARGDSVAIDVTLCQISVRLFGSTLTMSANSVTNVQHEGVDEGGIVKLAGKYLVVLRRGRLHTIRIGESTPARPVHTVPAYAPDIEPSDAWYDELLVVNDRVVVVGYSYERSAVELGLFRLANDGRLWYEATYQMRSDDYYSSRNYASRLVGTTLLLYAPLHLPDDTLNVTASLPAMRRWQSGRTAEFMPIVSGRNAYRPARPIHPDERIALHSVTSCDLAARPFRCDARVVIGAGGHEFYMSPNAAYVWTTAYGAKAPAVVHRMPYDGSAATALRVAGSPIDQLSFLESDDQHLNVVVHDGAHGGWMWSSEWSKDAIALLRVPLSSFGAGSDSAPPSAYRAIASGLPYSTQNRFVGGHVILGSGSGWGTQKPKKASDVYVASWRTNEVHSFTAPHDVERIEAIGGGAVLVGADTASLHFTSVALDARPRIASSFSIADAAQGETRSHGFFYKARDDGSGVLGLPIRAKGKPGYYHLIEKSAAVVFLRTTPDGFRPYGRLGGSGGRIVDDRCVASCVDWYGNSRPLFIGKRVFALLGDELVEGRESGGALRPVRRVSFSVAGRR